MMKSTFSSEEVEWLIKCFMHASFAEGARSARAKMKRGEKNAECSEVRPRLSQKTEARDKRMAELAPAIGPYRAAAQCQSEGLGSREAIARQYYRRGRARRLVR